MSDLGPDARREPFLCHTSTQKVVFVSGSAAGLVDELRELGCERAAVLTTPGQARIGQLLCERLDARSVGHLPLAAPHTPIEITCRALETLSEWRVDCLVAAGGGSAIGLAKALALRTGLPQVVLPTTYAGSEITCSVGQTEGGKKTITRSPTVRPRVIVYDVDLTLSVPPHVAAASGLNAIAHAAEGLYSPDADPRLSTIAVQGISELAGALPRIVAQPADPCARREALHGAWLCGTVLDRCRMALHHRLCHVLGGSFGLPHAATHAALLPHVLAYNAAAAPEAIRLVNKAIAHASGAADVGELARRLGIARSLEMLGLARGQLDEVVRQTLSSALWNPRPVEPEGVRALLDAAFEGRAPLPA